MQENTTNGVEVSTWLKAIRQILESQAVEQRYLNSISERQRPYYASLMNDNPSRRRRAKTHLPPEAYAAFWLLREKGVVVSGDCACQIGNVSTSFPHYWPSIKQERELRIGFTGPSLQPVSKSSPSTYFWL